MSDPGIALLLRHRVPAPLHLAGRRVVRLDVAGDVEIVAADAGDDVVLHDHRRDRAVVELLEVADLLVPALGSVLDVERDEHAVRRLVEERVTEHGHPAVADVDASLGRPCVVPDLAAGSRVDRPHVIGHGEIHHAVDDDRRAFDRRGTLSVEVDAVDPGQAERARHSCRRSWSAC